MYDDSCRNHFWVIIVNNLIDMHILYILYKSVPAKMFGQNQNALKNRIGSGIQKEVGCWYEYM